MRVRLDDILEVQPVNSADGDLISIGAKADAVANDNTSPWSVISLLKSIRQAVAQFAFSSGALNVFISNVDPVVLVYNNFGANVSAVVKNSSGRLISFSCYNDNILPRFIQIHNLTAVPAGGAVPAYSFLVPAKAHIGIGDDILSKYGIVFSTGITFAFSTTRNTYAAAAAGDQLTTVHYI